MNRKLVAAGLTAATALAAGASALAQSAAQATPAVARPTATSSNTNETFLITYGPREKEVVVAHGAFFGGGVDRSRGQKDVLSLGGGSLTIKHPDSKSHFTQTGGNAKHCYVAFKITGTYTLGHGTGKFAAYTGHGTYKVIGNAIAKRTSAGTCDTNANPRVEAAFIRAHGPVTKG